MAASTNTALARPRLRQRARTNKSFQREIPEKRHSGRGAKFLTGTEGAVNAWIETIIEAPDLSIFLATPETKAVRPVWSLISEDSAPCKTGQQRDYSPDTRTMARCLTASLSCYALRL
jgi:hypothetical protein